MNKNQIVLSPRSQGTEVKKLQLQLRNWGILVDVDGSYGPQTAEGVKTFQEKRQKPGEFAKVPLDATGNVDVPTYAELFKIPIERVAERLSSPIRVTAQQLRDIANEGSVAEFEPFVPGLNQTLDRFNINTPLRIAHFIAQVFHESGALRWREELASGDDYEGRTDLGNTQPGDGRRYKGRGFIQLTGRSNYRQFSDDIGYDFESDPRAVATPENAWLSAGWYWHTRDLNRFADVNNFDEITYRINGGYNGYEDRKYYFDRAKDIIK